MQKYSNFVLYVWLLFQAVLASGIVFSMLILHANAPGVSIILSAEEITALNPKAIDTMNALAILMNGIIAVFAFVLLVILKNKKELNREKFLTRIVTPLLIVQALGFASDSYFGNANIVLNILSSALLVVGLFLSARTLKN
jgi:hypothetical protein